MLEQIDDIHDYYARYLPQNGACRLRTAFLIVAAIFTSNWAAALILLGTARSFPDYGDGGMGAADANTAAISRRLPG